MAKDDQIRLEPEMLFRDMAVTVRAEEDGPGTISLAFSSETPVERMDWETGERFLEVLDHSDQGIDLSYARDGLPFLLEHDGPQVGLVTNVSRGEDKVARGQVTFGSHPDAVWVEKDMRGGIRKKVSVGYRLLPEFTEEERGGKKVRRYSWRPLEVSTVSIPADYSVGVGRSTKAPVTEPEAAPVAEKERTMSDKDTAPATSGAEPQAVDTTADAVRAERQRSANIAAMGKQYDIPMERVAEWVGSEKSEDAVRKEILDIVVKRQTEETPPGHVDMSPKERKRYSITRALGGAAGLRSDDGLEREVSKAIAQAAGRDESHVFIPMNLETEVLSESQMEAMARGFGLMSRASVTANVAGTATSGGNVVQTSILSLIELLRNRMKVRALGAQVFSGLRDNVAFPRQITANTSAWTGENPSTAHALTLATLDQVTLSPKTLMTASGYSKQLLRQGTIDIDTFIANDLVAVAARAVDLAAINGATGGNNPVGLLNKSIGSVTMGANGAVPTFGAIIDLETTVATANADEGALAYLTTPGIRGKLKQTDKSTDTAQFVWAMDGMNGYRSEISVQVPSNLTKGTSTTVCHAIIFGNWNELLIGEWGGALELQTNPYTYDTQNVVSVVGCLMTDINLRHDASFAAIKDALTS